MCNAWGLTTWWSVIIYASVWDAWWETLRRSVVQAVITGSLFVCLSVSNAKGRSNLSKGTQHTPVAKLFPGWRKLAQLMSDHLLRDLHRDVVLALVHHELETDKVGHDGARA